MAYLPFFLAPEGEVAKPTGVMEGGGGSAAPLKDDDFQGQHASGHRRPVSAAKNLHSCGLGLRTCGYRTFDMLGNRRVMGCTGLKG